MNKIRPPSPPELAILGSREPVFAAPVPVGQLNFPSWERYEQSFRSVFTRNYYTNQGPLTNQLEQRLSERLGVRHAIVVTNATLGLVMVAEALEIKGKVILPAFTFIATAQSLAWAGLTPCFCDIDANTHHLSQTKLEGTLEKGGVGAILAVNLWGGTCNPRRFQDVADRYNVPLYFDSAHAFGCTTDGRAVGGFGRAEVFSFHATKILNAAEGGCITTDDDNLAERLRNIRSSYGTRYSVTVPRTANGRMSEAQAAMALLSLDSFDETLARNKEFHSRYQIQLSAIPGIKVHHPVCVDSSNYQYLVLEVDEAGFGVNRNTLHRALRAENVIARRYFFPGVHRTPPFDSKMKEQDSLMPITDEVCGKVMQLPLGSRIDCSTVDKICQIIGDVHKHADKIRKITGDNA